MVKVFHRFICIIKSKMYYKLNGKWHKVKKKSVNFSSPSVIRKKREAFERKKLTKAFRVWRYNQYIKTQKGLCYSCKLPIQGAWTTDHKIPLARGGTSNYNNMVVCCLECNKRKNVRILTT